MQHELLQRRRQPGQHLLGEVVEQMAAGGRPDQGGQRIVWAARAAQHQLQPRGPAVRACQRTLQRLAGGLVQPAQPAQCLGGVEVEAQVVQAQLHQLAPGPPARQRQRRRHAAADAHRQLRRRAGDQRVQQLQRGRVVDVVQIIQHQGDVGVGPRAQCRNQRAQRSARGRAGVLQLRQHRVGGQRPGQLQRRQRAKQRGKQAVAVVVFLIQRHPGDGGARVGGPRRRELREQRGLAKAGRRLHQQQPRRRGLGQRARQQRRAWHHVAPAARDAVLAGRRGCGHGAGGGFYSGRRAHVGRPQ